MKSPVETRRSFPAGSALTQLLDLEHLTELEDLFAKSLTDPVDDFISRPGKNIRDHLVELGFEIAAREIGAPYDHGIARKACEILEIFHAGSLVVDDIEDGSLYRRGQQALHMVYGVPLALNAGNWLYFLPFQIIEDMDLATDRRHDLAQECQRTLLRAHYGQALDLGVSVEALSQERISGVSMAAMELKAGVLTGLALSIGAIALGASDELRKSLNRFGRRLGIALQMFDDIGNLSSSHNPEKACEDFKLKRLSYVFAVASRSLAPHSFQRLLKLTSELPGSCSELLRYIADERIALTARNEARNYLVNVISAMTEQLNLGVAEVANLEWMKNRLVGSYD